MLGNVLIKVIDRSGILIDDLITATAFFNQVIELLVSRAKRRTGTGKVEPIQIVILTE